MALLTCLVAVPTNGQGFLKKIKDAANSVEKTSNAVERTTKSAERTTKAVESTVNTVQNSSSSSGSTSSSAVKSSASDAASVSSVEDISGKVYYVSPAGSNRNDGTTPQTAIKDLQKAVDLADEGSTICIAEGNYLGKLDQGYVEVKKYLSLVGGWNSDFSARNPLQYITSIRPGATQVGTSGSHASLEVYVRGKRNATVLIDGIVFDKGDYNSYCSYAPDDARTGSPEGCETGRLLIEGENPPVPKVGGAPIGKPLLRGEVEGNVIVRNCAFINGYHFAIEMGCVAGHYDICNNVFVANRMSACEVRGMNPDQSLCSMDFHDNTVLFTWCRTKVQESMGVGFRFMTGLKTVNVYNNIFGCSNLGAVERTFVDAKAANEAARETNVYDNLFFMNRNNMTDGAADLVLPSGGGKWLFLAASQFEDAEQLKKYEGNSEMGANEAFVNAIDAAYLKGYMGINIKSSSSYDPNSAANQINRLFGMNQQGTEIVRASMFANRYPWRKALDLFGVVSGYGAQLPE